MPRSWITLILLSLAIAAAGCGDGDDSEKSADSASTQPTETHATTSPRKSREPKEARAARREAAANKRQEQELKDQKKEDREFDRSFEETSFERLVNELPIRKPPLHVEQYITGDGHKLYATVNRKRFCKVPVAAREKVVASFFRTADRSFRRGKVEDIELVVTPLAETIDKLPALATASRGKVSLTRRGRSC